MPNGVPHKEAAAETASESEYPFRVVALERTPPGGIDLVASSPHFRDITAFQDGVAVSAQAGLFLYDRGGSLVQAYRAGMELPPGELGGMAAGLASGSAERELFIATRGQGVLAFNGTRFRQILPENRELRDVTAVLALRSRRLLIGSRWGLLAFDGRRLTPFHPKLKRTYITTLAGDEGDLWIGTLENGLFHHHGGELEDISGALPDPSVLALAEGSDAIHAGTPMGVVEFRDGRRLRTLVDGFFARALALAGDTLQVGTQDEGVLSVPVLQRGFRGGPRPESGRGVPAKAIVKATTLEGEPYALTEDAIYRLDSRWGDWRHYGGGASERGRCLPFLRNHRTFPQPKRERRRA